MFEVLAEVTGDLKSIQAGLGCLGAAIGVGLAA